MRADIAGENKDPENVGPYIEPIEAPLAAPEVDESSEVMAHIFAKLLPSPRRIMLIIERGFNSLRIRGHRRRAETVYESPAMRERRRRESAFP
jgi:hypothetical protein